MHFFLAFLYPIFFISISTTPALAASKPRNAILLSEVESLTLRGDRQTTHRRVPAIPQLKCISHKSICAKHTIDLMRCVNQGQGYDKEDIQWSCTASLPPELKLGSTDVICEGYSGPDDPYVLKGSCGVEYRLVLTNKGEERWPELGGGRFGSGETDWSAYIFGVIFLGVLGWILYSACVQANNNRQPGQRRPRNPWGGGGGGGWGGGPGGGGAASKDGSPASGAA
ncbi:putative transmembrane protein [Phaeoacremonium minimum UCRPA7]|uniref:Store-operated calcium entry-associated regulatory factor n=1 Tax=Phaeoacremonium minimum (strain UCR-PA7) TaxID=1286976 RepID=R8BTX2_PHAM7|nr:putative transmembrane protein [Phaeoacremonium minimum UCRPA7]EOO02735.1 putative transmembrane protein [Phaeoacremonium minimum UCRPA7]